MPPDPTRSDEDVARLRRDLTDVACELGAWVMVEFGRGRGVKTLWGPTVEARADDKDRDLRKARRLLAALGYELTEVMPLLPRTFTSDDLATVSNHRRIEAKRRLQQALARTDRQVRS